MQHVDIVIADTKGPFSALIKARMVSAWSHTAMIVGDEPFDANPSIVEATFKHGVAETDLNSLLARSRKFVVVRAPVQSRQETINAQRAMIGAKYDGFGAVGLGFGRDWQDMKDWWCSETNYFAVHSTGNQFYRAEALHWVTPEDIWKLNLPIVYRGGTWG